MKLATVVGLCLLLSVVLSGLDAVAVEPQAEGSEQAIIARLASRSLMLDATRVGDLMVAVGERGHILVSRDHGTTWIQASVPSRATLTGVHFVDASLGFVVGHDVTILRTRDGGSSWERVYHAPEEERPLLDVLFLDERRGFAVGAYGLFLLTEDGGDTWDERQISEGDGHLNQMAMSSTGRLYMAAEAGVMLRSDDEGESWRELPSPYEGSFFGMLPLEDEAVLAFGLRGHLYRSTDGGRSWTRIEVPTTALLASGAVLADGTVIVAGLAGTVLESRDGGRSFKLRQLDDRKALLAMLETPDGDVIRVGENGVQSLPRPEHTRVARAGATR